MSDSTGAAAYEALLAHLREANLLGTTVNVLAWDQETMLPPRGASLRAEQIAARSEGPLRSDYAAYASDISAAFQNLVVGCDEHQLDDEPDDPAKDRSGALPFTFVPWDAALRSPGHRACLAAGRAQCQVLSLPQCSGAFTCRCDDFD